MSLTVNCVCGHVFATITGRHVYVLHTIETTKGDNGLFLICPQCQSPNAISERQADLLSASSRSELWPTAER
jgi:DNA-binding cell septation regulator SpoVG